MKNPLKRCFKGFCLIFRAENETRTRDPNLGKVVLYQLSYFRIVDFRSGICCNRYFLIASAKIWQIFFLCKYFSNFFCTFFKIFFEVIG